MKECPLQIYNIKDLIKFNSYVRKNHIKGKVVQKNFSSKASSLIGLAIALPLECATLIIDEDCNLTIDPSAI